MIVRGPTENFGHAIAYHPQLAAFFESVTAAVFFAQLRYWMDRTDNPLGVYKTAEEWTIETGLSYREQATARRALAERGFVVETHKRLEHRLFFRVDWDVFNAAHRAWLAGEGAEIADRTMRNSRNAESAIREEAKAQSGDDGKRSSLKDTEITTETTADIPTPQRVRASARAKGQAVALPLSPTVIELPLNVGVHAVTEEGIEYLRKLYPSVNVRGEFAKMLDWCNKNPSRRKTKRGISDFITTWLSKAQDEGKPNAHNPPPRRPAAGASAIERVRAANAAAGHQHGIWPDDDDHPF
jgi:hypothetical protein